MVTPMTLSMITMVRRIRTTVITLVKVDMETSKGLDMQLNDVFVIRMVQDATVMTKMKILQSETLQATDLRWSA